MIRRLSHFAMLSAGCETVFFHSIEYTWPKFLGTELFTKWRGINIGVKQEDLVGNGG